MNFCNLSCLLLLIIRPAIDVMMLNFTSWSAADLGDYENEERDAEYLTEQSLLSSQVSVA